MSEYLKILYAAALLSVAAQADEVWFGLYQHDVTIAQVEFETGHDIKAGWIGEPSEILDIIGQPSPYLLISANVQGATDYLAIGLNGRFGDDAYVRPGLGLAIHNGPSLAFRQGQRVDLGSPILFEPEFALGWQINDAIAVEASWLHLSHATLF